MILLVLLYALGLILAMEIAPERHETEYINPKYLKNMSISFRKYSRNSPHFVNMELDAIVGVGNNLTVKMEVYEYLGGHYIPTPIIAQYKLCDFLYKEPFFGQMYAKQLPANWSCPFPAGQYHFMNLTIHLENFPYNIPFTYSSLTVRTRVDIQGTLTDTNEEVFRWKTFIKITQKLEVKNVKTKTKAPSHNFNKELLSVDVYPERVESEYRKNKFITFNRFTFRKRSRNSPYYIDLDFNATSGYGNNLTIKWKLAEFISGRYLDIPVHFEYNLCDFLYKDKYIGQMIAKQLRGNWSCPFPSGRSIFRNLVMHLESFPIIPFTYSSDIVRVRVDIIFMIGQLMEEFAVVKVYMTFKQKLREKV